MNFKSQIRDFGAFQKLSLVLFFVFLILKLYGQDTQFEIYTNTKEFTILYDEEGSSLDSLSASILAENIYQVINKKTLSYYRCK